MNSVHVKVKNSLAVLWVFRTDQVLTGQVRTGKVNTDQIGTIQVIIGQPVTVQTMKREGVKDILRGGGSLV